MKDRSKIHRLFAPDLASGAIPGELPLPAGEVHHALHVLRLREGDEVEVFDGAGHRAAGRAARVGRSEMSVAVESISPVAERTRPAVHLAFAMPKGDRLDWLLEKATELAAASLQPIVFERSLVGREDLTAAKRQRWLTTCVSAAKQSGLDYLPELHEPSALGEFLSSGVGVSPASGVQHLCLVGDLSDDARPMREAIAPSVRDVTLLVGPEGGFTEAESTQIRSGDFLPVRLGPTTLRIETAAIALLAAVRVLS